VTSDREPRVVASRELFRGKVISLRVDEVEVGAGRTATREVVEHRGAAVFAAVDDDERVHLVRQYRHAIGKELLEFPAGGLEEGEDPLETARRELAEELGLAAREWTYLGSFYSSPGFANELLHAYIARGLSVKRGTPDEDEELEVVRCPLAELLEQPERLMDGKSLAPLSLLRRHMNRKGVEAVSEAEVGGDG
jgi:ADP-ribose pyrophosphatase